MIYDTLNEKVLNQVVCVFYNKSINLLRDMVKFFFSLTKSN